MGDPGSSGVVWFGEQLPEGAMEVAERAAPECNVILVARTSGAVWPAAGLAQVAREAAAHVAILNPQPNSTNSLGNGRELPRSAHCSVIPAQAGIQGDPMWAVGKFCMRLTAFFSSVYQVLKSYVRGFSCQVLGKETQ